MHDMYTVIHLLVVDVACVLFWTQSVCMVPNQNTRNIYHKQMNNGVQGFFTHIANLKLISKPVQDSLTQITNFITVTRS